jgi:hypothetical protein
MVEKTVDRTRPELHNIEASTFTNTRNPPNPTQSLKVQYEKLEWERIRGRGNKMRNLSPETWKSVKCEKITLTKISTHSSNP